ncbi:MAG TPA: CHAD domain-containing protein [Solirubrobacteraceae bacterium]|nr:CHAD domain-containing protein [Solirubrobacteraceae bacterium]
MSLTSIDAAPDTEDRESRAFRLLAGEDLPRGLRRVASTQLAASAERLRAAPPGERVEAVHEARKSLKRERALLRLVRGALDADAFKSEDARMRDIGRALAAARDAEVMLATLQGLLSDQLPDLLDESSPHTRDAVVALLARLHADAAREREALERGNIEEVAGLLGQSVARVPDWAPSERHFKAIAPGLIAVYARGREERRRARRKPDDDERLHDWRKSVKYLRHCAEVLEPLRPGGLGRTAATARRLGDVLGEHHDLAVLRELAAASDGEDLAPLLAGIDVRREELAREAFALGAELYARPPERFALSVRRGWRRHSRRGVLEG